MNKMNVKRKPTETEIRTTIEKVIKRCGSKIDTPYWRGFLVGLIKSNAVPLIIFENIPLQAGKASRTRFDQVFGAAMSLAFPGYRKDTLRALLGPSDDFESIQIWRAVFPAKFGLAHILIRANSYQQAFAFACDYACRASLRLFYRIPNDLTIRLIFMSEKAIRRHLSMRWANRVHKRKQFQLGVREFTPKQINGARLFALGKQGTEEYSIAKYSEEQDLRRVREKTGLVRISSVEHESHRK
jgi:hypothetical protein